MKPEPLDASRGGRQQQRSPLFLNTAPSSVEEVRRWGADYRNVSFLERFISSSGRIQSRRKTKLPMAEHKIVTKQIKVKGPGLPREDLVKGTGCCGRHHLLLCRVPPSERTSATL